MARIPRRYAAFQRSQPEIWRAYDTLGATTRKAGPLPAKTRELVKLALSIGAKLEGAVHSHTRRALDAGATAKEVLHVVLLGITTLGFPSTMSALTWVEDVLKRHTVRTGSRRLRRK
jgi:4-carboxymuconolactone decarboxylase